MKNEKEREGDRGCHDVCWGPRRFTPLSFIISHHPELPASYDARTGLGDTALCSAVNWPTGHDTTLLREKLWPCADCSSPGLHHNSDSHSLLCLCHQHLSFCLWSL